MRALTRILINLVFLVGTAAAIGWAATLTAYQHAPPAARIAVPVVIAVVMFTLACAALRAVPSKAQLNKRKKGTGGGLSYSYAVPAKRR